MAKPIVLLKVDIQRIRNGHENPLLMVQNFMQDKVPDYNVLTVPFAADESDAPGEPIQLQVFYDKDFTPVQYDELKGIVKSYIEKDKTVI